jgi:hypothetical protein
MDKIKIGDTVNWRGCWGFDDPKPAEIKQIELCTERSKEGTPVPEIDTHLKNSCVFTFTNNHWAYGKQIEKYEN